MYVCVYVEDLGSMTPMLWSTYTTKLKNSSKLWVSEDKLTKMLANYISVKQPAPPTLIRAIRLLHTMLSTFHTTMNIYYHIYKMYFQKQIIVCVRRKFKSYKFCAQIEPKVVCMGKGGN